MQSKKGSYILTQKAQHLTFAKFPEEEEGIHSNLDSSVPNANLKNIHKLQPLLVFHNLTRSQKRKGTDD